MGVGGSVSEEMDVQARELQLDTCTLSTHIRKPDTGAHARKRDAGTVDTGGSWAFLSSHPCLIKSHVPMRDLFFKTNEVER